MSKIIRLPNAKDPDSVLEQAVGCYDEVIIVGWGKDGEFDFRAGGVAEIEQIAYILSRVIHKIHNGDYFPSEDADL